MSALIIEGLQLIILFAVLITVSVTDIRRSLIPNRILMPAAVAGVVLLLLYYILPAEGTLRPPLTAFIRNALIMTLFSVILYATHIWAAGDSKLMIVIALLLPTRFTLLNGTYYSEFMIVVFSFILAFFWLVIDSVMSLLLGKQKVSKDRVQQKFRHYLRGFAVNICYLTLLLKLEVLLLQRFPVIPPLLPIVLNIALLLLIGGVRFLHKWYIAVVVLGVSVIISLITGIWEMNLQRLAWYGVTAALMLLEIFLDEFNYAIVPTSEIRPGMVLSRVSLAVLHTSRIKGLPTQTTEDLRSRLTPEQADAIHRWGRTAHATPNLQIVRKIPFAIFLSLSTVLFLLVCLALR